MCPEIEASQARTLQIVGPRSRSGLMRLGVSIWHLEDGGAAGALHGTANVRLPFDLRQQSKFQNSVELIAVVVGFVFLTQKGYWGVGIRLVGDSRTSLKWGLTERFKGVLGLGSTLACVALGTAFDLFLAESVHVAGKNNVLQGRQSRGITPGELGFDGCSIWETEGDSIMAG